MKDLKILQDVLATKGRENLSILPTRIYRLDSISDNVEREVYCMRDDLTGFAFGGNKTRKLDYIMHEAKMLGADSIVTYGSNQSNWCRMTSAAGAACGMDVYLLLDGNEPSKPTGNLILDKLAGANIVYLNNDDDDEVEQFAKKFAENLKNEGRLPYYIPVGGSTTIGTLGYIRAFYEIGKFCLQTSIDFDRIVVATGSAGTQAGLVVGKILSGWKGKITGISVGRERSQQEQMIETLVKETLVSLGFDIEEVSEYVVVKDQFFGEGYRKNTRDAGEAIRLFASTEGIFLDEVYTGKAAAGMLAMIDSSEIDRDEKILFLHTGGAIQLFE